VETDGAVVFPLRINDERVAAVNISYDSHPADFHEMNLSAGDSKPAERSGPPAWPILAGGHRLPFLLAGLYAIVTMAAWSLWLAIHAVGASLANLTIAAAPHVWHGHEMIFGYAPIVLTGFFLTAVPNWTGSKAPGPAFIAAIGAIWAAGRMAVWSSALLPAELVAIADLGLFAAMTVWLVGRLAGDPKPRNLVFIAIMVLLATGNGMVHLEWAGWATQTADAGLRVGLLTLTCVITIVGGRIVPAFTRNALHRIGRGDRLAQDRPLADRVAIAAAIGLAGSVAFAPEWLLALLAALVATANSVRLAGWRGWRLFDQPIVWTLHLAFALLTCGYAALAVAWGSGVVSEVAALHLLGIGGVGGMTLAVMTRAILGHSGRPLKVHWSTTLAYVSLALAAVIRTVVPAVAPGLYFEAMFVSAALWILAFTLFIIVYGPIVCSPDPIDLNNRD
jgi:uncharacterized protein involved in response to NO